MNVSLCKHLTAALEEYVKSEKSALPKVHEELSNLQAKTMHGTHDFREIMKVKVLRQDVIERGSAMQYAEGLIEALNKDLEDYLLISNFEPKIKS